jgi:hypothetical protein
MSRPGGGNRKRFEVSRSMRRQQTTTTEVCLTCAETDGSKPYKRLSVLSRNRLYHLKAFNFCIQHIQLHSRPRNVDTSQYLFGQGANTDTLCKAKQCFPRELTDSNTGQRPVRSCLPKSAAISLNKLGSMKASSFKWRPSEDHVEAGRSTWQPPRRTQGPSGCILI